MAAKMGWAAAVGFFDASLKGRIRVEPGEASERVQARSRPTERFLDQKQPRLGFR